MELDPDLAAYFHTPRHAAVLVTRVQDLGSGTHGGLRTGDVILQVAGREVRSVNDITDAIDARNDGDPVEVVVWRQEKRQTLRVAVESHGAWLGRTRPAAAPQSGAANEERRREIQKLRRDIEELRREVDILRRRR
jgi:predicted metalloprotease with PDZ domain